MFSLGMESVTSVQTQVEAACVFPCGNALDESMNPSITDHLAISKLLTWFKILGQATNI